MQNFGRPGLVLVAALCFTLLLAGVAGAQSPGTAFTYQGQLANNGLLVNETCDFVFGLHDAATGGAQVGVSIARADVAITEGLFSTRLDFGPGAFNGAPRWLAIRIQCEDDAAPVDLLPRQEISPSPYAMYADAAPWAGILGKPVWAINGYTAGAGLTLSGATFSVNPAQIQRRVVGACPSGQAIASIGVDGNVGCVATSAGGINTGLTVSGSELAITDSGGTLTVTLPSGLPGPQGPAGPAGTPGPNGPAGPAGPAGETGPAGPAGPQGPSGVQGEVGPAGADGAQGAAGPAGPAGPQGDVGPQGIQGEVGPAGAIGPIGPPGDVGPQGLQGDVGPAGPQGPQGDTGATGAQGPIGLTGPQGPQGDTGPAGAIGPIGPPGLQGDVGPVGPQGPQGDAGATGAPGAQGPIGLAGPQGPQGDTGPAGAIGPIGPQGLQGDVGPVGPQGPTGDTGAAGAPGVQGPIGLAGPQGPQGDVGPAGAIGPIGPIGPQGLQGDVGPVGPQGPTGDTGAAGAQGAQGPIGLPGPQGLQGDVGPAGANGATGPAGPAGAIGPVGPQGLQGDIGPVGPQGVPGDPGAAGAQGPIGLTGPQGPQGDVGPAGAIGPIGPQGPQGDAGAAGAPGAQGPIGLTGPQGPQGDVGPAGADGATGPAGPQGATGAAGPAGADGPPGATGPAGAAGPEGPVGPAGPDGPAGATGATGAAGPQGPAGPAGLGFRDDCGTGALSRWDGAAWVCSTETDGSVTNETNTNLALAGQTLSLTDSGGTLQAVLPFWNLTGNSGTAPATAFLGTTDNVTMTLRANSIAALRLVPGTDSTDPGSDITPNVFAGAPSNGGGSEGNFIGGGANNLISSGVAFATILGGNNNLVSANLATASGSGALATLFGQRAYATGSFAATGDAQASEVLLRGNTTNNSEVVLSLDGLVAGASNRLTLRANTSYMVEVSVTGRQTGGSGGAVGNAAAYRILVGAENQGGTINLVGTQVVGFSGEDTGGWNARIAANSANDSLDVVVEGDNNALVRWVAQVKLVEVSQ